MIISLGLAAALAVLPDERLSYEELVKREALAAAAAHSGQPCPEARAELASSETVQIAAHPNLPAQRQRVRVTGCGRTSVQNINVGRMGGSPPWRMASALPGASRADLPLQQSAFPAAVQHAREGVAPGCQAPVLRDVYIAAGPGEVRFDGDNTAKKARFDMSLSPELAANRELLALSEAWIEVWPLEFCGEDRTTGVVFIPLRSDEMSAFVMLPIWEQVRQHGPQAMPAPVPD